MEANGGDCNAYALITLNAPIMRMVYMENSFSTFWKEVNPLAFVELLYAEIHASLMNTIACKNWVKHVMFSLLGLYAKRVRPGLSRIYLHQERYFPVHLVESFWILLNFALEFLIQQVSLERKYNQIYISDISKFCLDQVLL